MNNEEKKIESTDENIDINKPQTESSDNAYSTFLKDDPTNNKKEVEKDESQKQLEEVKTDSSKKQIDNKRSKDEEFSLNWHLKVLTIIYATLFIFYIILKLFLK